MKLKLKATIEIIRMSTFCVPFKKIMILINLQGLNALNQILQTTQQEFLLTQLHCINVQNISNQLIEDLKVVR